MSSLSDIEPGPRPDQTNQTVLRTPRLELSFGTDADAAALFPYVHGAMGRPVTKYLLWDGPETVEDIASFFRKHTTGTFVPHGFHWVIRDRTGEISGAEGEPMGSIGISQRGPIGRCSLGYWLAPPYWGKRVGSEAARAVVDHGFNSLGVVKFEAEVFTDNPRSAALLESIGFVEEGLIRLAQHKRRGWIDEYVFGMTRHDLIHRDQPG